MVANTETPIYKENFHNAIGMAISILFINKIQG